MTLGQKITALRKAQGMTQEALSEAIGVTRQTISKWELDASTPDLVYLCALADLFGVTTDSLIRPEITLPKEVAAQENGFSAKATAPAESEPSGTSPSDADTVDSSQLSPPTRATASRRPLNTRPAGWVMMGLSAILLSVGLLSLLTDNEMPELMLLAGVALVFAVELLLIRWHPLFIVMWTAWCLWSLSTTVLTGSPWIFLSMLLSGPSNWAISIAFLLGVLWLFYTAFCLGVTVAMLCRHLKQKRTP